MISVCERFAARKLTGTLEKFFQLLSRKLSGTFEQFFIFNVGLKKKAKALLDFQIIVNPGGGKC